MSSIVTVDVGKSKYSLVKRKIQEKPHVQKRQSDEQADLCEHANITKCGETREGTETVPMFAVSKNTQN